VGIQDVEDHLGDEPRAEQLAQPRDRADRRIGPAAEGESRPVGAAGTAAVEDVDVARTRAAKAVEKVTLAHRYDGSRKAASATPRMPMIVRALPIENRGRRIGSPPIEGAGWIAVAHSIPGRQRSGILGDVAGSTGPP
jgi:hypothetical protein